ncbi:Crp/Fnr family transcriptional regulator [Olsenella porci]|uniref:Cyclic nucleotide-binding domain-containing protein n=1 Tax=Olsenella porci TaxID=2652279 RepID=A0A6N7X958_9ACTN|nr:cyclic nucleotide-binding domain-containing protein [Olsenella porci]MST72072.1 cyclic nucleotide-binding domain-containing protein [Olsenella porci]
MAPSECPFGTQCAFHRNGAVCMSQIRLFAGLDLEARRELLSHATQTTYQRGDIIVAEGDPIDSILIVRSGRIKTFRVDPSGEETVLDILHDGQAIWHGMFLEDNVLPLLGGVPLARRGVPHPQQELRKADRPAPRSGHGPDQDGLHRAR